jgi:hypothetical protein
VTTTVAGDDLDDVVEEAPGRITRVENLGPLPEFEAEIIGPTWQVDPDNPDRYLLPEHTLGYAIITWCAYWLNGAGKHRRWTFTPEQARFVLWFYAVDTDGAWLCREAVLQRVKGWGKDPLAAVLCAVELIGPCRLGGWRTPDGVIHETYVEGSKPYAVPLDNEPWVQIVGTAKEQTKNTMSYLQGLFTQECRKHYRMEINRGIIYALDYVARIEVVTSSPGTMEGNRPSFVVKGEPQHWYANNDGLEVAKVVNRNIAKMAGPDQKRAHALAVTNAYDPQLESHGQTLREEYEEGTGDPDVVLMYDSIEAPEDVPLLPDYTRFDEHGNRIAEYETHGQEDEVLVPPDKATIVRHLGWLLERLRGDSTWLDPRETAREIMRPKQDIAEMRRFYTNAIVTGDAAYLTKSDVDATIHPMLVAARKVERGTPDDILRLGWSIVGPDEPVVLFFDGSKNDDSTAIVGCRVSDQYVFLVGLWEKPRGKRGDTWLSPRAEVDNRFREACQTFNVVAARADPSHTKDDVDGTRYWDGIIDGWHELLSEKIPKSLWAQQGGERASAVMWDMTNPAHQVAFSEAVVRFGDEMDARTVLWDGHPGLRSHLLNGHKGMGQYGAVVRKPRRGGTRKIDALVCTIGAKMLARLVAIKGLEVEEDKSGEVWVPRSFMRRR